MSALRERLRTDPLWRAVGRLDVPWGRTVAAVLLGAATLGSALGLAAVSAWLIARASQMPPVLTLSVAVVSVRAFGISRGVFRYLERLTSHSVALRGMARLREHMYLALAQGRLAAVAPLRRGDLLARVGQDVDHVGDVVVRSLIPAGVALVVSLGAVVLETALLPSAGVLLAACLVLAGVVAPVLAQRGSRDVEVRTSEARARMSAIALEILEDSPQLVVAGRMPERTADLRATDAALVRTADDAARPLAVAAALANLAVGVAVLGAVLLGVPAVTAGTLSPVALAVVVLTPLAAFEATTVLPAAATQLLRSRAAATRIMTLLDAATPPPDPATASPACRSQMQGTRSERSGAFVAAEGVACGWGPGAVVVEGLDLELAAGRVVALVGPSGIGKTTALMTLAGLVPPLAGTVTSGTDASTSPLVLTTEDAHLFRTTILENLRVARGTVTPEEATRTLDDVGLGAWLAGLPDGLDTDLDAATVSGGERRRLLVARALLADAPLLGIDEPAEHLDAEAADAFMTELVPALARAGRGVVVATHRLSGLEHADEVIVLARRAPGAPARVTARGTHVHLLDTDASYREAWQREQRSRR
ncbi:thiol reductant ABC exporter subunit CydC [Flavimobilis marinus]|uniref:ATP-binding cassette, subfamily C, CydC n=1 Tax=Flavimobilis marinus TaxID=285351 RepID=A0A1I2G348_9MICO|nr:thiol reductant ABC exporter subunit CydC [Flavimobilis marinus]GHG50339.1 thiol reductant ABC exporter subunit CydC [Flavimobilis marinus]SFF11569.1 ATP-binding cassette, subfamily C, CydC [Flavimobilis marinus]